MAELFVFYLLCALAVFGFVGFIVSCFIVLTFGASESGMLAACGVSILFTLVFGLTAMSVSPFSVTSDTSVCLPGTK